MPTFECDACGKRVKAPEKLAGRRVKCPGCGEAGRVPSASATKVAAATATAVAEAPNPLAGMLDDALASRNQIEQGVDPYAAEPEASPFDPPAPAVAAAGAPAPAGAHPGHYAPPASRDRGSAEGLGFGGLFAGVIGGLAGAGVGAAIWAGICYASGYEVGYVAVAVGFLAGLGTVIASSHRGVEQGMLAAVMAGLGILAGKLGTVALMDEIDSVQQILSHYDILWVILAIATAFKVAGTVGDDED